MDDSTEVLSLDELMDLAATAPAPARPAASPPPTPPPPPVARPPRQGPTLAARAQPYAERARQACETGYSRSRDWLTTGDNGLIAATVLATLLLLLVVGTM